MNAVYHLMYGLRLKDVEISKEDYDDFFEDEDHPTGMVIETGGEYCEFMDSVVGFEIINYEADYCVKEFVKPDLDEQREVFIRMFRKEPKFLSIMSYI